MKARLTIPAAALLIAGVAPACTSSVTTAPDLRPELEVHGRVESLEVNPAGSLWFGTATGRLYVSRDWNLSWSEVPSPAGDSDRDMLSSDVISRVRFFDAQRGIVTGYLGTSQDFVYRTTDGGTTWSTVRFPAPGSPWVYDAQTTDAGLAWLVGSDGGLYFSDDFAASWSALSAPFDDVSRSLSVHFVSRSLGVVGSLGGSLKVTRDGGRSWRRMKSPAETGVTECKDARVDLARILGERVVIRQCGAVFSRAMSKEGSWLPLRVADRPLVAFAINGDALVAVASDFEIVDCARDLQTCRPTGARLDAAPLDITTGAARVVFIDTNLKVSVLEKQGLRSSRMLGTPTDEDPPLSARDRGRDGAFWGVSRFFLYRSRDEGRTWERQAELPREVDGLAIQDSGDVLIWSRHGLVTRWSPEAGRLLPVPALEGLDIVGLFRRGSLWLAYGGMQDETTRRIEVARTYFSGQFHGTADHGYVAASLDGGASWRVVDEWKDGGVQSLFLGEDGTLTLLSWLCAVRRGRLSVDAEGGPTASLQTILPATDATRHQVPYVEHAHVLDFLGGQIGWVKGWTHHLGDFLFYTLDGGRTWKRADVEQRPYDRLLRLGDGSWLGLVLPHEIRILKDGVFVPLRVFPRAIDWTIVDATGSLVLHLDGGETWQLQGDGKDWLLLSRRDSANEN